MQEMTEIEQKKAYLKEYEKAVRRTNRSEEKIMEMRLSKIMPSTSSDGLPHTHNNADLSGYVALIEAEEKKYLKVRYQRIKICKDIVDKIERMENEDEKDILMYRYIKLMKWDDICAKIGKSWKQTHRIHSRALNNFII